MMWWTQGWGWGGWLGMSLVMLVFWAAVIWLIVSLTGFWSTPDAPSARQRAEQVLADRFGDGDITAADYQDRPSKGAPQ
jgi:putative membrane protein